LRRKALTEEPSLDLDLDLDPASIWISIGWASEPARRNSVGSGWADGLSGGSSCPHPFAASFVSAAMAHHQRPSTQRMGRDG
jgi:hypothetical protein